MWKQCLILLLFGLLYVGASPFHHIDKRETENCAEMDQVKCNNTGKCIHRSWFCDGTNDCGDNSDEIDCSKEFCKDVTQFRCKTTNKCIIRPWVCDGEDDCGDNSDEMSCTQPPCQNDHSFRCGNTNRCIAKAWICDGDDDCGNNIDEINCGREIEENESCEPEEYKCKFSNRCISQKKLCDGQWNCQGGDDENEEECPKSTCTGFQCRDGQCLIDSQQVCDGTVDCKDKSDESDCSSTVNPITSTTTLVPMDCNDANGMFPCDNNKCISLSQKCDGKDDCGDNSDENLAKCNRASKDSSSNPEPNQAASWNVPLTCNVSSNFKDQTPHLTFNFFFKK